MGHFHIAPLVLAVLLLCCCRDTVTSRYETRTDAEADRLFERGWLPEIIPQSSYDLSTKNDLDANVSEGGFFFTDATEFIGHLRKMKAAEVSGSDSARFMEKGYWPYSYRTNQSWWIFFINRDKGHCEYRMGLINTRGSP